MSIYTWQRKYLKYGMVGLMAKRKSIPRKPLPRDASRSQSKKMQALQEQVRHLQFEVDVLKETIAVLNKDCSPTNRQENMSLSQNIEGLHGFAPDFVGSKAVLQVNALNIVEVDVLSNQFFNLSASRIPSTVQAFGFERTKEVLHGRVAVGTSGTGHGRPKVIFFA